MGAHNVNKAKLCFGGGGPACIEFERVATKTEQSVEVFKEAAKLEGQWRLVACDLKRNCSLFKNTLPDFMFKAIFALRSYNSKYPTTEPWHNSSGLLETNLGYSSLYFISASNVAIEYVRSYFTDKSGNYEYIGNSAEHLIKREVALLGLRDHLRLNLTWALDYCEKEPKTCPLEKDKPTNSANEDNEKSLYRCPSLPLLLSTNNYDPFQPVTSEVVPGMVDNLQAACMTYYTWDELQQHPLLKRYAHETPVDLSAVNPLSSGPRKTAHAYYNGGEGNIALSPMVIHDLEEKGDYAASTIVHEFTHRDWHKQNVRSEATLFMADAYDMVVNELKARGYKESDIDAAWKYYRDSWYHNEELDNEIRARFYEWDDLMEGGIRDRFQWLNSAYTSEAAIFITQSLREIVLDDCDMTAEQKKIAQKKIDNYQTYLGLNNLLLPLDRIYYSLIRIMLPTFLRHSFQPSNLIGKLLGAV